MFLYSFIFLGILIIACVVIYSQVKTDRMPFDLYVEQSRMTQTNKSVFISLYNMYNSILMDLYAVGNSSLTDKQKVNSIIDVDVSIKYCERVLNKNLFKIQKDFIKGSCSINKAQEDIQELKRNYANISEGLSSIDLADKEPVHKIYSRIVNKAVVLNSPTALILRSRAALLVELSKSNPSLEGECVAKLKVLDSKLDLQLYKRS